MVRKLLVAAAVAASLGSAGLGSAGAMAAPVVIDFTGEVDQFNPGPLTAFSALSGQIVLDDTTIPAGINNSFENAILSFALTVAEPGGPVAFAGAGGRVQQFVGVGGTLDFIQIGLGGSAGGSLTGSAGGIDLIGFGIDFRGPALFADPTVLATGLTGADFTFSRMTLNFDAPGLLSLAIDRSLDTVSFSGDPQTAPVPAPAPVLIFALGLLALAGARSLNP